MRNIFKKSGNEAPDIIYTQEFRLANGVRYLDYMERKEAINGSPEAENELKNKQNVQGDPDVPKDFKGYLGYTDRKAATKMEDDLPEEEKGDYPTFTQDSFQLTEGQHQQLVDKLKQAQENKALLWAGVVSFSPEFIKKAGLIDKNGKVNQKAIKAAIMNAMPEYLRAEGMDNGQTFWWGDIHLNTDHVHVHLAMSQMKNTRPLKENGEPKGMFHTKSIRKLKSLIHHELADPKSRSRQLSLEKDLDYQKGQMLEQAKKLLTQDQHFFKLIRNLAEALPNYKDRRKWRASNHSVDFRESRDLAYDLVDYMLNNQLKASYQAYMQSATELDQINRENYGQKIHDTVKPRDNQLRERMVNQVFKTIDKYDNDKLKKLSNKDRLSILKEQGPELNSKIIDDEVAILKKLEKDSVRARQMRMRLGQRRFFLKQTNLDTKIERLNQQITAIQALGKETQLQDYQHILEAQRTMYQLEKKPKRILSPAERKLLATIQKRFLDVKRVPINKVNEKVVNTRLKQLQQEKELLMANAKDPAIPSLTNNLQHHLSNLDKQQEVLKIKLQIAQNNKKLPKGEREKVNGPMFQHLKRLYYSLDHPSYQVHHHHHSKNRDKTNHQEQVKSKNKPSFLSQKLTHSLSNLLTAAKKTNNKRRMRALRERLDTDDDLEREDRLERQREQER